jgi:hypothetical protein
MGKRHKPEEIIAKLRQVEVMTGQGTSPERLASTPPLTSGSRSKADIAGQARIGLLCANSRPEHLQHECPTES